MRWYRLAASGLLVVGGLGCVGQGPVRTASAAPVPEAPREVAPVSRAQAPDGGVRQTSAILGLQPERVTDPQTGRVAANIRALVNNVPILDEEVRDASFGELLETRNLAPPQRAAAQIEIFDRALQKLVEREVILQDAQSRLGRGNSKYLDKLKDAASKEFDRQVRSMKAKSGAKTEDELRDILRSQGMSLDGMRRQFERSFMAMQYMRGQLEVRIGTVTNEQVREYYAAHPEEFQVQDGVQWQDIFIDAGKFPDRATAQNFAATLAQRAQSGEDFAKLAQQYDNGDSSYRGGEGFGRRRGEVRPAEAEAPLFRMRDGEVGPVIPLGNGFHVIRLVKRTHAGVQPLDDKIQTRIRDKMREEMGAREYKRLIAELKRGANIEYNKGLP